ncbi:hypothetical protein QJS04_geneDACA011435 [Acorus gramineus]|uniref:Uncharacterized protein n=1 Tax=Acorus gramineus TaxID=55184 RepID=A0AAV9AN94_ACOGR|nr:hypothetical protein QJS04_geneDACA011435 [Acorus gramineus]
MAYLPTGGEDKIDKPDSDCENHLLRFRSTVDDVNRLHAETSNIESLSQLAGVSRCLNIVKKKKIRNDLMVDLKIC